MKENTELYGWLSNELNTHMITNHEWGAVAYLSKSEHGAHIEVVWNNSYMDFVTGCSGPEAKFSNYQTCIKYNTENGVKASTTHNIYGVYDMVGGAWERTMAGYNNVIGISGFSSKELLALPNNHLTKYTTTVSKLLNGIGMDYDINVYGDGVYETSDNATRHNGSEWIIGDFYNSWEISRSSIPYNFKQTWFDRGGSRQSINISSVFSFNTSGANPYWVGTFRPILTPLK